MGQAGPCCCSYGAAVAGEWPEFECYRCPRRGGLLMSDPGDLCRRHRRERRGEVAERGGG
ncbi:MAG TPA: hypothetical protein VFV36_11095 [Candidatus Methylomirabilis sp.]|nr:hypothetical protein [Candidatus Methylomirabilis sp.]